MPDERAIGRIHPDGPWIGFRATAAGYRFMVGSQSSTRTREADSDLLLAMAIAYFEEAFEGAPPELEATHEDVSELVRHVAAREADPTRKRLLDEAVDAIDDGLAGDAVASRLSAARPVNADEQADPIDLLVSLTEELLED